MLRGIEEWGLGFGKVVQLGEHAQKRSSYFHTYAHTKSTITTKRISIIGTKISFIAGDNYYDSNYP